MASKGTADFATSILAIFVLLFAAPGRADEPTLVLISIDGFGWNFLSAHPTPALDRIAAAGVRAESMRPVFPSLTFPNHYSIATGLYPAEHGIVHNRFPDEERDDWYQLWDRESVEDGRWYGGEPIWVTAEKHGRVSAAYYFVGTEAAIQGVPPSYWHRFDASVPGSDRVDRVIDWLGWPDDRRPRLITLYFEHVDTAGHDFGLGSAEHVEAVAEVDAHIGRLLDAIAALDLESVVSVLVVSDHGQADYVDPEASFVLRDHIDLAGLEIIAGGAYAWIYQEQPDRERALAIRDAINENWEHGRAVLRDEAPADWRISRSLRFPEIFLVPDLGHGVVIDREGIDRLQRGDHGWDPSNRAMHGIFLAAGPGLPRGRVIGEVSAVEIYPLMLWLLQIEAPAPAPGRSGLRSRLIGED